MIQGLLIDLALVKAGKLSKILLDETRQIVYFLYQAK